jgi:hypothetical protein
MTARSVYKQQVRQKCVSAMVMYVTAKLPDVHIHPIFIFI